MKITVLLKYFKGELNPFDAAALECALEIGAEVTALAMAPISIVPSLESITRLGVRAILISDQAFAGSDTQATSYILSEALKRIPSDHIFAGRQSMDGDTSQVPPMIAQRLGLDIVCGIIEFDPEKLRTRSGNILSLKKKTVYTFERIRALRFPSIFSKKGEVEIWSNASLSLDTEKCGSRGSPTRVIRSYESSVGRRECKFASLSDLDDLIREGLSKERAYNTGECEKQAERIFYVGDIKEIAEKYAAKAIRYDPSGKTPTEISDDLNHLGATVVLFESCDEYKALAARLAVICEAGLCADCISFRQEDGSFIMTRPALGGSVTADIVCNSKMSFATVRNIKGNSCDLVFAVGRGAIDHLGEISQLAEKYGARLAASRSVVDDGFMPYEAQVGLTGKSVSPRVYVAFGISGAVQHTSAISGAGTIIAINTDKDARIFDYSDYGIVADIKNLFEEK